MASLDFSTLEAAAAQMDTVEASVIAFVEGVGQVLADNAANQAKILELAGEFTNNASAIAAAVVTGTPAEPPVEG